MRPSRHVPQVGDEAEIVHLAARDAAVVTAADGRSVEVMTDGGEHHVFELNRVTANFVRRGEPYWGTRLTIRPPAAEHGD